jgi:alpha-tubulin suppressor-like RCC1 family protein
MKNCTENQRLPLIQVSSPVTHPSSPLQSNKFRSQVLKQAAKLFILTSFIFLSGHLSARPVVTGTLPVVKVEGPQAITVPSSSITLRGSATPASGHTIASHTWTKLSGGAATISSPSSDTTVVTGLVAGTYVFQYTAKDNAGQTATGTILIAVNSTATAPVLTVGGPQAITAPSSTVTLYGKATAYTGRTIYSHEWTKSSGGTATITSPSSDTTVVSGLVAGSYTFLYTVMDNAGQTSTASVVITVNASGSGSDSPPVITVGGPQAITVPSSTVTLYGKATPYTGHTISSHTWAESSGGAATITSATSDTTVVSGLVAGSYTFVFTATDNAGEKATGSVTITVNAASTPSGSTTPVPATTSKYSIASGEYANFILDNSTQTLYGVGSGSTGKGTNSGLCGLPIPCQFPSANTKIKFVAAGLHTATAIDVSGNVYFTGANEDGTMGNGTTTGTATSFVAIPTDSAGQPFTNITYLTMGSSEFTGGQGYGAIVYAIRSDGTLWVWGNTEGGYRGDGTYGTTITKPVQITSFPAGTVITKVVVQDIVIALDSKGNVWTWAGNGGLNCLLGNILRTNYMVPQILSLPGTATDIAGGGLWSYALLSNGSLYGWGLYLGYMGVGATASAGWTLQPSPLLLNDDLDLPATIAHISCNTTTTYAILTNGTLWSWGGGECGQVGNGQDLNYAIYTQNPAPYGGSTPTPYAWNWDMSTAQLQQHKPMQLAPGIDNFVAVSAGSADVFYEFAVDNNGQLYSWGRNKTGILANGVIEGDYTNGSIASLYPNSWDVPYITAINPFEMTENILSTSPECISSPGASSCSAYSIPVNTPPVANAGSNQTVAGPTAVLDGSASKDNVAIVYYIWSQVSGPNTAVISIPSGIKANLSGLTKGVYVFKLKVIDNGWLRDSANVTITVQNTLATTLNDPALFSASPASLAATDSSLTGKTAFGIYPNPVTDGFALIVGNQFMGAVNVQLIDVTGVVRHEYLFNKDLQTMQYNISAGDLLAGVYFLRVQIGSWTGTLKVLKK